MAERPIPKEPPVEPVSTRPVPLEDLELVEKVRMGDSAAYAVLVRKYQDRVYNTCWRISGNVEDARDLTQDAFLKAYERIGEFRQLSGFYTWVFRIAVNLALSQRRSVARKRTTSLDAMTEASGSQAESLIARSKHAANHADQHAIEAEMQAHVARALQTLDEEHRAVVVLRDMEGLDYAEIAGILDVPAGTVKSRLHRARMAIRQAILPLMGSAGPRTGLKDA